MTKLEQLSVCSSTQSKRALKPKPVNPIEAAIRSWLETLPVELVEGIELTLDRAISNAPKRWVVYPPMVLLPSGSFGDEWWSGLRTSTSLEHRDELWRRILDCIGKREGKGPLANLAVNAGIPLHKNMDISPEESRAYASENILRTPSGLIMLFGDFGPALPSESQPKEEDFEQAFWVRTKQNGITQIWAPRYTMFSRGNVKEKARLLDFHNAGQSLESRRLSKQDLAQSMAVDLYAGIGYFVFSYVKMGISRVVGWELNPWSVEGLRRGAIANGWSVKVIKSHEAMRLDDEQITVMLEDNRRAAERLEEVDSQDRESVRHVNCGLLPTGHASWNIALGIVKETGWLHLHVNVGVEDVHSRRLAIEGMFKEWLIRDNDKREVQVEHVELVKTFAPGVWHCVFDVYIRE
jgi:tRNA wybutosine-synthesizing protein 2